MGAETGNYSSGDDLEYFEPELPEDEEFHQKFMAEIRQKEQLDKIKESRGVNFEEDDDDFIIDLNSSAKQISKVSTSTNNKEIKSIQS